MAPFDRIQAVALPLVLLVGGLALTPSGLGAVDDPATLLRRAGIQPIEPRSPAIDLALPILDGGEIALSAATGDWMLLTFWASWCQPCVAEMPSLEALDRALDGDALVLTVSVDSVREKAAEFLRAHQLELLAAWDEGGEAARAYRATSIPLSYVIDPRGRIAGVARGARDWSRAVDLFRELKASAEATAANDRLLADDPEAASDWQIGPGTVSLPIRLTPPSAEVLLAESSVGVGETFHVDIRVNWAGDFEEYLLRTPKISVPDGVEQLEVSARTGSEMGRSAVTYRVSMVAREAGRFALDPVELRYVPRFETEPVSTLVEGPVLEVASSVSRSGPLGLALATLVLGALSLTMWWRRRVKAQDASESTENETSAGAQIEIAKRLRFDGDTGAAAEQLQVALNTVLADRGGEGSGATGGDGHLNQARSLGRELEEVVERSRFAGSPPSGDDLDRLSRRVERLLESTSDSLPSLSVLPSERVAAPTTPPIRDESNGPSRVDP